MSCGCRRSSKAHWSTWVSGRLAFPFSQMLTLRPRLQATIFRTTGVSQRRTPLCRTDELKSMFAEVDPRYGTNADVTTLIDELHKRGMKLLLDLASHGGSPRSANRTLIPLGLRSSTTPRTKPQSSSSLPRPRLGPPQRRDPSATGTSGRRGASTRRASAFLPTTGVPPSEG